MPVAPGRYAVLVHPREISDGTAVPGRRTGRLGTLVRDLLNICELAIFGDPNTCFWRNASINVLLFSDRYVTCKLALVEHRKKSTPNGSVTALALHCHLYSSNSLPTFSLNHIPLV